MQILIVDDHAIIRNGLRALLSGDGNPELIEADNGRAAVAIAAERNPDVIIMDLMMPDLNGVDATRQICRHNPDAKVIVLSARTDGRTVRETLEAGASAFVAKESAYEELATAVRAVQNGEAFLSPRISGGLIDGLRRGTSGAPDGGSGSGAGAGSPYDAGERHSRLSAREREVLQLTAEGLSMKEVAGRLQVSVKTVETHRRQLMEKLHLYSIAELTKYAIREGLTTI
jgi:DNA-binding NarL/FixJ family response regulator